MPLSFSFVLGFLFISFSLLAKITARSLPPGTYSAPTGFKCEDLLRKLKELRLNRKGKSAVWYYTGVLRNPVSGAEIVGIEGVERCVEVPGTFLSGEEYDGGASGSFSFLSSKLFAYTDLQNRTKPVTLYRVQPAAPCRPVNPLSEVNSVVTLGYRRRYVNSNETGGLFYGRKDERKGIVKRMRTPTDFFSVVRWPSGRAVHTNNINIACMGANDVVNNRNGKLLRGQSLEVVHYMNGVSASKNVSMSTLDRDGSEAGEAGMPYKKRKLNWRKWVTFSGSGSQPWHGKSQEYYSINGGHSRVDMRLADRMGLSLVGTTASEAGPGAGASERRQKPLATMHYKRFGEGPEWYAVGRPCSTELTAYKYASLKEVPWRIREMLETLCPAYFDDERSYAAVKNRRKLSIFSGVQRKAKLKMDLKESAELLRGKSPEVSKSAMSNAESDLSKNIDGMKLRSPHLSTRSLSNHLGGAKAGQGTPSPKWGTEAAFRQATDMRASRRFVPWYKKLLHLSKD